MTERKVSFILNTDTSLMKLAKERIPTKLVGSWSFLVKCPGIDLNKKGVSKAFPKIKLVPSFFELWKLWKIS